MLKTISDKFSKNTEEVVAITRKGEIHGFKIIMKFANKDEKFVISGKFE